MEEPKILRYLLPEPPRDTSPETLSAFARLWEHAQDTPGDEIAYDLFAPKWQFLSWLAETHPIVLHGSSLLDLSVIEPRSANDVREFSAQTAIYASTDGIWTIFFAILNRTKIPMGIVNSSARVRLPDRTFSPPYYFFSIDSPAMEKGPFCDGMIYILSRATFQQDPMRSFGGFEIDVPHWASPMACRPLARLPVSPADFPFLAQVRAHDPQVLWARAQADPDGFPWIDD
jgi:hypothetical protein